MYKRIYASLLLVGFILLLINILVFRWQPAYSAGIYMLIVVFYLLFPPQKNGKNETNELPNDIQRDIQAQRLDMKKNEERRDINE